VINITLKDIKPGHSCIITGINMTSPLRKRLIDMGLTIGTLVKVRKYAPLGDPIELNVRGYELSLRKSEAAEITVKKP